MMQDAIDLLVSAGEHQKRLFYSNFLSSNKVGEIICVQCDDSGDTYMFERWSVTGIDFIVAFRLLSEDSMIVADISYQVGNYVTLQPSFLLRSTYVFLVLCGSTNPFSLLSTPRSPTIVDVLNCWRPR